MVHEARIKELTEVLSKGFNTELLNFTPEVKSVKEYNLFFCSPVIKTDFLNSLVKEHFNRVLNHRLFKTDIEVVQGCIKLSIKINTDRISYKDLTWVEDLLAFPLVKLSNLTIVNKEAMNANINNGRWTHADEWSAVLAAWERDCSCHQ